MKKHLTENSAIEAFVSLNIFNKNKRALKGVIRTIWPMQPQDVPSTYWFEIFIYDHRQIVSLVTQLSLS